MFKKKILVAVYETDYKIMKDHDMENYDPDDLSRQQQEILTLNEDPEPMEVQKGSDLPFGYRIYSEGDEDNNIPPLSDSDQEAYDEFLIEREFKENEIKMNDR